MQYVENKHEKHVSYAWGKNGPEKRLKSAKACDAVGFAVFIENNDLAHSKSYVSYVSYAKSYTREPTVGNVGNHYRFPTFRRPAAVSGSTEAMA